MFPFSNAERSHMRSALKLQIVLSHYRHGNITEAKHLFSKLYNENGPDEEYQDDIRELFQSENDSLKDTFLRTHTYDRFLMQVQQFFTPVWKKFETPVLAESTFLENLREESGLKIDAKTLKALFFAWDQSEEAEQNWSAVVEGTHLNIKELKNKKDRRNLKDTDNHSTDKITRQVIKSRGAATNSQQTSLSVNIERCDEVLKKLKASSRRLFSGLKDDYSDMIAGKAGPSGVVNDENASGSDDHDHDTGDTENGNNHFDVKRQCKSAFFISSESPNDKKVDTRGKRPLERKAVKRRFNEEHSDAEIVEWESDDETDLQPKMIKLPSPHRKRCLNVKLPTVKHRKFWTAEETKLLEDGVKVYGEGNWTRILNAYNFVGRTSVNLKDRWRTLRKNK
ncbi:uncharacterized protein [Montipora capricornis]|uniref:uncharacterized protein n=1 Tax=Montipora capricornis TaxID=246305 RepID=UPI0035F19BB4